MTAVGEEASNWDFTLEIISSRKVKLPQMFFVSGQFCRQLACLLHFILVNTLKKHTHTSAEGLATETALVLHAEC